MSEVKAPAAQSAASQAGQAPKKANGSAPAADIPQLQGVLGFFETSNTLWRGTPPRGCKPEDLSMHPTFWNNCSPLMGGGQAAVKSGDTIRMLDPEYVWCADFLVCESRPGFMVVKLLWSMALPPRNPQGEKALPTGYAIHESNADEHPGYVVIRLSDGFRMHSGLPFSDYESARRFIVDHPALRGTDQPRYLP